MCGSHVSCSNGFSPRSRDRFSDRSETSWTCQKNHKKKLQSSFFFKSVTFFLSGKKRSQYVCAHHMYHVSNGFSPRSRDRFIWIDYT